MIAVDRISLQCVKEAEYVVFWFQTKESVESPKLLIWGRCETLLVQTHPHFPYFLKTSEEGSQFAYLANSDVLLPYSQSGRGVFQQTAVNVNVSLLSPFTPTPPCL